MDGLIGYIQSNPIQQHAIFLDGQSLSKTNRYIRTNNSEETRIFLWKITDPGNQTIIYFHNITEK